MNKIFTWSFLLFLSFLVACKYVPAENPNSEVSSTQVADNELSALEKANGWKLLFDGKSTKLWRGYKHETFPTKGWHIDSEDNLAVSNSGGFEDGFGGDIITLDKFENFILKVDFMVSDTGNSGVFYRAIEAEGAIWNSAPEYQVLDNQTYIDMGGMDMSTHLTAENYDLQSAPDDYTKPVGEWNSAMIKVDNDKVEHWLNGEKTIEYTFNSEEWKALVAKSKFSSYPFFGQNKRGHLGLQDHGHLVKFKNIKVKELPSSGLVSLFNGKNLDGWEIYGTEKWLVENGNLVCESGPDKQYGYLATDENYKDFDLQLEFLQESDGNSGVFFRSTIEGTKIAGWQAEVAPPGLHTGGIYESYGRGWMIQPPAGSDSSLKMGEWNSMRIVADGKQVTTWLNGNRMIDLNDEKIGATNGKIALQIHDGGGIKVRWRNIKVKEL